jgi:hypothetical protein
MPEVTATVHPSTSHHHILYLRGRGRWDVSEFERLVSNIRGLVSMIPRGGKRYMFELARQLNEMRRFKPVIVAGYNVCILALLDEAMVRYDEVHEIVPPYQAIVANEWRAERLLEEVGWTEGLKDMYFIATCHVGDKCIYHLYDVNDEEGLLGLAAYLAFLTVLDDLASKSMSLGLCRDHDDCLGFVVKNMKDLAPIHKPNPTLLNHLDRVTNPHEIYCTRDMLLEHKH